MALKRLTVGEMITATQSWVDPEHRHHALLKKVPEVAPLLPRVTEAHRGLLATQPVANPQAAGWVRKLEELDLRHDDLVRGSYYLYQALSYLSDDAEERERWEHLHEKLFPAGLSVVSRSYEDEAGQAQLALARLSEEDKKFLRGTTVVRGTHKLTVLQLVERYGAVAASLGQAVQQRSAEATRGPARADAASARNAWLRAVNAVRATLDLAGASEEIEQLILGPLRELEARADRRRGPQAPNEPKDPAPTPDPDRPAGS